MSMKRKRKVSNNSTFFYRLRFLSTELKQLVGGFTPEVIGSNLTSVILYPKIL